VNEVETGGVLKNKSFSLPILWSRFTRIKSTENHGQNMGIKEGTLFLGHGSAKIK